MDCELSSCGAANRRRVKPYREDVAFLMSGLCGQVSDYYSGGGDMFARRLIIIITALMVAFSAPVFAGKYGDNIGGGRALSDQEIADLVFMREEEKLAHDVYVELYEHYDGGTELIVFANIAASEQRHMDAMLKLLNKYRIEDPAEDALPGVFENPVLAELYESLVSDSTDNGDVLGEPASGGKVGVEEALYVGAWIEERDMLDILHAIEHTGRADIVGVYTNLLCGSRSHLRAFVGRIGEDYQPQILADDATGGVSPIETFEYWMGDESNEICM